MGCFMHTVTFLSHFMDVPITIFAWVYIWRPRLLFMLIPLARKYYRNNGSPSVGFNHIIMKLKRPKLEMPNLGSLRFAQFDLQQKNSTSGMLFYNFLWSN